MVDLAVMGAVEKVRSLVAADHAPRHMQEGDADGDGLARFETRRRQEVGHGGSTLRRPRSPASPVEPPTPPRRPPEARSGSKGDAAPRSPPPCRDIRRVDDNEADEPGVQFLAPGTYFLHDFSDTDSSVSVSNSMYRSMTPSPTESPTCAVRQNDASNHGAIAMIDSDDARVQAHASITDQSEEDHASSRIVDFSDDIWCPPPPEDESDDVESRFFGFDDEDDVVGDSSNFFGPSFFSAKKVVGLDGVADGSHKESVQNDLHRHFRALVAQLLRGEGINLTSDNNSKSWLEIVSSLAWQAANFVKPDTKKGGSMDPSDYVKIKCIASGNPAILLEELFAPRM